MRKLIFLITSLVLTSSNYGQEIISTEKLPEVVLKGNGDKTLLLIPCMSGRWNEWEEFMERNVDKYKMVAVTLPGYGGTPVPDLPKNSDDTPWRNNALSGLSELIDEYNLKDIVVVGHSWGSMVTVQLAAMRKDVISRVISVDGTIQSTTWTPSSKAGRLEKADSVIKDWEPKLKTAEGWSRFNGATVGNTFGKTDSVTTERMLTKVKLVSSFMATDRDVVLQYWRENMLIDLTASLLKIDVPVLDIQSFTGKDQKGQKDKYLSSLKEANAPSNVRTAFMYDTKHFIMYHRPLELDCLIEDFVLNKPVRDFASTTSEYFEEETMN